MTRTPSGPSGGGDASRQRILDAAEELFARDGYDATPTSRIARIAKVPKGLVFYYFPRKIDVLLALLDERLTTEPLVAHEEVVTRGDVARTLTTLAERLDLGNRDSAVLRTIVWRESDTHPEVRRRLAELYQALFRVTRRAVVAASAMAAGHPRLDAAVQSFVAAMLLQTSTEKVEGPQVDLREVADLVAAGVDEG